MKDTKPCELYSTRKKFLFTAFVGRSDLHEHDHFLDGINPVLTVLFSHHYQEELHDRDESYLKPLEIAVLAYFILRFQCSAQLRKDCFL